MSGGTCRKQSFTDASDSSTSRHERTSSSSRKISRGKGDCPSIPVADITRSHSFYNPVMSDDSGRNSREGTMGSAGDQKSTSLSESGTSCGEERKTPQPETFTHSDPSDHRSGFGSVQTTTIGRLGDADLGLSASSRTECVSRECIPGMDDVSVMWSTLESKDGPGRHSGEGGADIRSTSTDTSLPRMCINDATTTDGKQHGVILRMQSVSYVQKRVVHTSHTVESRLSPSTHSRSAAQPMAEQVMVLDSDSVGWEESFTMLNVPEESADKTDVNADIWEAAIRFQQSRHVILFSDRN